MWFKHGTIASYAVLYLLAALVDYRAHLVCEYCRILLYLAVHRRTVLVVIQLRCVERVFVCDFAWTALTGWPMKVRQPLQTRNASRGHDLRAVRGRHGGGISMCVCVILHRSTVPAG